MQSAYPIVDLTKPLSSTTTPQTIYPGDPTFHIEQHASVAKDGYSVHSIHLGTHTGTHVDAPCHFIEGARSIDQIDLDELVGKACIVHLRQNLSPRQKLSWDDLEGAFNGSLDEALTSGKYKMLLVNGNWAPEDPRAFFDHPYFSCDIARKLLSFGIRLFGTDYPNPDETPMETSEGVTVGGSDGYTFHETFLGGGGLIVESLAQLDLLNLGDAEWIVSIIPLKLAGADGSPVRAFAQRGHWN